MHGAGNHTILTDIMLSKLLSFPLDRIGSFKEYLTKLSLRDNSSIAIILSFGFILAILLFGCLMDKPVADDYWLLSKSSDLGLKRYPLYHVLHINGRFSSAIFIGICTRLFHSASIVLVPFIIILGLLAAVYAFFGSLPEIQIAKSQRVAASFILCTIILLTSPSLYDTAYWFSSSTVYLLSLIFAILSFTVARRVCTRSIQHSWLIYLAIGLLAFCATGFSESIAVFSIPLLVIEPMAMLISKSYAKINFPHYKLCLRKYFHDTAPYSALLIGFCLGVAVISHLPSTARRIESQGAFATSLHSIRIDFGYSFHQYSSIILKDVFYNIGAMLAIVACALVISSVIHTIRNVSYVYAAILTIFIPLLILMTANISNDYEGNLLPPYRLMFLATTSLSIGTSLLASKLLINWHSLKPFAIPLAALLSLISTIILGQSAFTVIHALAQRYDAYNQREMSIYQQLGNSKKDNSPIYTKPVPVLLVDSQTSDVAPHGKEMFLKFFAGYYHINVSRIVLLNNFDQSMFYCSNQPTGWVGDQSCTALTREVPQATGIGD